MQWSRGVMVRVALVHEILILQWLIFALLCLEWR